MKRLGSRRLVLGIASTLGALLATTVIALCLAILNVLSGNILIALLTLALAGAYFLL